MDLLFHKQSSFQASQAPTGSFDNQATKGDGLMHNKIEIEQSMQRLKEIEKEGGIEGKGPATNDVHNYFRIRILFVFI